MPQINVKSLARQQMNGNRIAAEGVQHQQVKGLRRLVQFPFQRQPGVAQHHLDCRAPLAGVGQIGEVRVGQARDVGIDFVKPNGVPTADGRRRPACRLPGQQLPRGADFLRVPIRAGNKSSVWPTPLFCRVVGRGDAAGLGIGELGAVHGCCRCKARGCGSGGSSVGFDHGQDAIKVSRGLEHDEVCTGRRFRTTRTISSSATGLPAGRRSAAAPRQLSRQRRGPLARGRSPNIAGSSQHEGHGRGQHKTGHQADLPLRVGVEHRAR